MPRDETIEREQSGRALSLNQRSAVDASMLAGTDFAMLAHRARTVKGPTESRWKVWLGLLLPLLNLMYRKGLIPKTPLL